MLNEEICRLLDNIEKEVLDFVRFVKHVEEDYGKIFPQTHGASKKDDQKQTAKSNFEDENDSSYDYALPTAFEIVKTVLYRMQNLLDEFSAVVTKHERDSSKSFPDSVDYFYNQYVYQVAAYLIKILEENLSRLSDQLTQSGESESQTEHKVSEPSDMKKPKFKFKFSKPATLFTQDDKIYEPTHSRKHKPKLKPPWNDYESDWSEDSEMFPSAEFDCQFHKCYKCNRREYRKSVVFNCIMKSLNTLVSVIEEVLKQVNNSPDARSTQAHSHPPFCGYRPKREDPCSCSPNCTECEKYFETMCEEPKCKHLEMYKMQQKEKDWQYPMAPKLHPEPYWMEKDPRGEDFKEYACHDTGKISHQKEGASAITSTEKSKEQEIQNKQNLECGRKIREKQEIDPDRKSELQTGTLGREIHSFSEKQLPGQFPKSDENEMDLSSKKTKTQNNHDKIPSESELTLAIIRDHGQSEKGIEATLRNLDNPHGVKNGSGTNPIKDVLNKFEGEDFTYPQTVVFDVKKFSQLLKEKLLSHSTKMSESGGRSESKLLLDIVVTSFDEASAFNWETHKRIVDRRYVSDTSTETSEEYEEKADKAVDDFTDEIISISTKIAETEKEIPKKIFGPQEERPHFTDDESILHTFTTGMGGEETVKIVFPGESSDMKAKLQNVQHACTACTNMLKSNSTESNGSPDNSPYLRRRKKSLVDTCFRCWNSYQRGLAIHQCHSVIPTGILEIRHMDAMGNILVCFLGWDRSKEPDDWRWQKNPFPDQTRVEIEQEATEKRDPVVKVIYGDEGNMIKESLALTTINTVGVCSPSLKIIDGRKATDSKELKKHDSSTTFQAAMNEGKATGTRQKKQAQSITSSDERNLVTKLGRFYDEVLKFGYGKGPPLILKVRKKFALNDAYNLLMCNSQIRLHYYRNLRVVFISDDNSKPIRTSSNFVEEDRSNELFDIFGNTLFGSEEYHLFEYPSEEAHFQYINPDTLTHPQWFEFAGAVLGLAFLHQKRMQLKISKCLFKCLLNRPLALQDLQSIDPLLYQKLMWLKENDISTRKVRMNFVIQDKIGNQTTDSELMVNGKRIAVTETNKFRYIELAVKWRLAERCLSQLKDFRRGFASVIDPCFLTTFTERELLSIIKQPPEDGILTESYSGPKVASRRGTW